MACYFTCLSSFTYFLVVCSINFDFTFDDAMATAFGCTVKCFDPRYVLHYFSLSLSEMTCSCCVAHYTLQAPVYLADDCCLVSDSTRCSLRSADVQTLVWYHEHTAAMVTELLQPLDLVCGTLYRSICVIQTSPTDCYDDS